VENKIVTKENIAKGLAVAFAAVTAAAGIPYVCGYAQASLAPEATTAHLPTLKAECRTSRTIHEKATCLVLDGIQLARN
jgi:hypothetical protein